jgi:hypothetical protein
MPFRGEQNELRLGSRDAEFNPALRSEGLVGHYAEAEFFGVELQSPVLIANRNARKLDTTNHFQSPSVTKSYEDKKARSGMQSPI